MNVQRLRSDILIAAEHFPNVEAYTTNDGGLYIKAALQTSVGQAYVISITFAGYPNAMPNVTVITPDVGHWKHRYNNGHICYMLPSFWNPAKHDVKYVLAQTAVWLNKHEIYKRTGAWPGPELAHAS